MKRLTAICLTLVLALSLAACGSQKPSQEEVEQAIEAGNVTLEDAVEKGWVTQEWADQYIEERSVPAADKVQAGAIGEFTTTTLSGEEFTREDMAKVTCFVFLDPADPEAETFYQALTEGYEGVKEAGAEILVCTKSQEGNEMFQDSPFPVILYNDSLKKAVESHQEMIEGSPNTSSWCVNGSFFSAWSSSAEAAELGETAASFVEMEAGMSQNADGEGAEMAVMG